MAGLSGIVKKISDLVTGTPADDDCFVFGKSDLKKITLAKLKDALGITSINSSLTETENYCVNEHHAMYIRIKGYTKELIMLNTNGFTTTDDVNYGTVPEKYRPLNPVNCWINLNGLAKAHLSISTNGIVRIYEATVDTPVGSHVAINHTFL